MRFTLSLFVLFVGSIALGEDTAVTEVLKRFDSAKPSEKSLAFYSLDWVCSLADAKKRANVENRFILLILNTNISAHCNFYSGHT
jgi:thioredoxin-related protein